MRKKIYRTNPILGQPSAGPEVGSGDASMEQSTRCVRFRKCPRMSDFSRKPGSSGRGAEAARLTGGAHVRGGETKPTRACRRPSGFPRKVGTTG